MSGIVTGGEDPVISPCTCFHAPEEHRSFGCAICTCPTTAADLVRVVAQAKAEGRTVRAGRPSTEHKRRRDAGGL